MATTDPRAAGASSRRYPWLLTFLLSLNFGILFFDRNALNFPMPWVKDDLGLTNTQVDLTASALSQTWALAGCLALGLRETAPRIVARAALQGIERRPLMNESRP